MIKSYPCFGKNLEPELEPELEPGSHIEPESGNHDANQNQEIMMEQNHFFLKKEKEKRRETSTGTRARTRRDQEIIMEQRLSPARSVRTPVSSRAVWGKQKKEGEGRQAPEPTKNQEIMMDHDPLSEKRNTREEGR